MYLFIVEKVLETDKKAFRKHCNMKFKKERNPIIISQIVALCEKGNQRSLMMVGAGQKWSEKIMKKE